MGKKTKAPAAKTDDENEADTLFAHMGLDGRLLKSLARMRWKNGTAVQAAAIPLAIQQRKDILTRARTGSGKTGAFFIPVLHMILAEKKRNNEQRIRAVILTASRELALQIKQMADQLNFYSANVVTMVEFATSEVKLLKSQLAAKPDILIGTPARLVQHVQANHLIGLKDTLQFLVLDEADLMFSFGHEKDIEMLTTHIIPPHGCQSFLLSATLNTEVAALKKLCLKNAAILKLEEAETPDTSQLTQYHVQCEQEQKYTLLHALFKLKLIKGRTLIFANTVEMCYRLRLFLEQFGIRSCILNPELPVTSRCHVVAQFNQGKYEILIASDEKTTTDAADRTKKSKSLKKKDVETDSEFGVARGIDFQFVSNVINFDFPPDVKSYVHRIGRTARGDRQGTALSFVSIKDQAKFQRVKEAMTNGDEDPIRAYEFRMEELDGIAYRCRDAVRAITRSAIAEARTKEIKRELLNSEKLQTFFKQHPKDYKVLRSDTELHTVKQQPHLKNMPEYIIPPTLRAVAAEAQLAPVLPDKKRKQRSNKHHHFNPLKTFSMNPKKRKT